MRTIPHIRRGLGIKLHKTNDNALKELSHKNIAVLDHFCA